MGPAVLIIGGFAVIMIMSMVLHEYAHGYVANLCGDYTAEAAGRLTLNPLKHIDPFMTILLPAVLLWMGSPFVFGGAKPVPINPYNLRHMRRDLRLVSAAGVTTNLIIALGLSILLRLLLFAGVFKLVPGQPMQTSPGVIVLGMGIIFNLILFAFNLMPVPPLDGSRILRTFLPAELEAVFNMLDRFGLIVIFALLSFSASSGVFFSIVRTVILFFWGNVLQLDYSWLGYTLDGFRMAWHNLF